MPQNDRKKVVNTEEQNLPVNPGDRADEETVPTQNEQVNNEQQVESTKSSEVERAPRIEGDETAGIDRKIPKL